MSLSAGYTGGYGRGEEYGHRAAYCGAEAMTNRRKVAPAIFIPLFFGIIAFYNVSTRPSFATYRAVDVVTLIAVGVCFGAALVALVMFFRGPRSN